MINKIKTGWPVVFFVLLVLFQSCSGRKPVDRTGFLPPVKIRIPREALKDSVTVAFVRSSEQVVNELSDRMENIALHDKDLLNKKENELSLFDKLRMAWLNMQFLSAGNSLANQLDKIQQYIHKREKNGLSKTDVMVCESVRKAVEKRIEALNKKYKHLLDN